MRRINHRRAYSADGACTNQAESYFSRLRRAEIGLAIGKLRIRRKTV
jgi:hypothetical protein